MMEKKQQVRDARELCVKRRLEMDGKSVKSENLNPPLTTHELNPQSPGGLLSPTQASKVDRVVYGAARHVCSNHDVLHQKAYR